MDSPTEDAPALLARRIVEENSYMTIATADADGHPWATPVWFAALDLDRFFWVSRSRRRHSENLARRPEAALVIFDSTVTVGAGRALYADVTAGVVPAAELAEALDVFNARAQAKGLRPWLASSVSDDAPHRLYRATASRVWILDENEDRVPVV